MTEETKTEELEFDVVENPYPQAKIFCYKVTTPNGKTSKIGVVAMCATDAKDGLLSRLPPETTLTFLLKLDTIQQV